MKSSVPTLLPLLRSDLQGEIMAEIFLSPGEYRSMSELSKTTGGSQATVLREINRLEDAGLVESQKVGRSRLVRAGSGKVSQAIQHLMQLTYGPRPVLADLVSGLPGIREAYIYGSWAAARSGEAGEEPNDIDVLIVGNPPQDKVYDLADTAEEILHREVNVRTISEERWGSADPFVQTLRTKPLVDLKVGKA